MLFFINLLPDFLFYLLTFVGIICIITGVVIDKFIYINKYKLPIQIIGTLLLVIGVLFIGGINVNNHYKEKIAELEQKVLIAEKKSSEANAKVEIRYINRVQVVKQVQWKTKQIIKEKEKIINQECKIVPEVIQIHNQAASNEVPE